MLNSHCFFDVLPLYRHLGCPMSPLQIDLMTTFPTDFFPKEIKKGQKAVSYQGASISHEYHK